MPRSKRQDVLLRHDQILGALEKVITYLAELHDMFAPHHPQYAVGYENILYMLTQAHEFVEKMKSHV
jgi:benzoyl-CoA reductase/2-hydroxyglutaryl-CoA dehydratase subunit BcrC/BadD/HgdB